MKFVRSSDGPWGFFDPAGSYVPWADWTSQWFSKGHSYIFQLVGIAIFVLIKKNIMLKLLIENDFEFQLEVIKL